MSLLKSSYVYPLSVILLLAHSEICGAAETVPVAPPGEARAAQIMEMLVSPHEVIPPVNDRLFWDRAAENDYLANHILRAEAAMKLSAPAMQAWEAAYLEFSKSGDRARFGRITSPMLDSIRLYSLAECIENKGRFIPALEQRIREICAWPTWVANAHDHGLRNLRGEIVQVDLVAARTGSDLSSCLLLFGERLDPEIRNLIVENLRRRILEPFRKEMTGQQKPNFWLTNTNNWNAVCLSGIVVTALGGSRDPEELAWYLAASERMINNFLAGFSTHGYCSEGLAYWSYGYGHFIVLTEYIRRITGGELDLFDRQKAQTPGLFPFAIEVTDGVYPAYADCPVDVKMPKLWAWYVARRLGLEGREFTFENAVCAEAFSLYGRLLFIDPETVPMAEERRIAVEFDPLRQRFSEAGVVISRLPGAEGFGLAVKAGNNGEHHNHNDVGSFVIAKNGVPVICDPGKEHYTRDTFSDKRYLSPVHNSFGHNVPVVAGELQGTGREFAGKILEESYSDEVDALLIDLKGAYPLETLEKLTRRVVFDRKAGTVTITDEVRFSQPESFATALVSYGEFHREGDLISVKDGGSALTVEVSMTGAKPVYGQEVLEANWQSGRGHPPTRFAIACDRPVTEATLTCVFRLR